MECSNEMMVSSVQWCGSAVQCRAVQCSAVQHSAVVKLIAVQWRTRRTAAECSCRRRVARRPGLQGQGRGWKEEGGREEGGGGGRRRREEEGGGGRKEEGEGGETRREESAAGSLLPGAAAGLCSAVQLQSNRSSQGGRNKATDLEREASPSNRFSKGSLHYATDSVREAYTNQQI